MTLTVEVQLVATDDAIPTPQQLGDWARAAWQDDGRDTGVVVRVTDEAESRQLNRDYRGISTGRPMCSRSRSTRCPVSDSTMLGDLVVCAPGGRARGARAGQAAAAHWAHMVVHGMLHLQGYDHEGERQADEMEALETRYPDRAGLPGPLRKLTRTHERRSNWQRFAHRTLAGATVPRHGERTAEIATN